MTTQNSINVPLPFPTTDGGTGVSNPTAHGIMIAEGASPITPIVLAAGEILIGTTAGDPAAAALTAGTGISITSISGAVTIAATGSGGPTWVDETSTGVTLAPNTNYVADNASLVTFTLPVTAALGDTYQIVGKGAGGWAVAQGTGQSIQMDGATTTTTTGSLSSTVQYDCITLTCITANTVWAVTSSMGNITVV